MKDEGGGRLRLRTALPMNSFRRSWILLVAVGLLGLSGGCDLMRFFQRTEPPPQVLPPHPTLQQVIQAVNQHSAQIQTFVSNSATLTGPNWPSLQANIAFARPQFFRLRAGMGLTGAEADLGSNDQIFWYWVRRDQPPAIYFCSHERFAASSARQAIPIDPYWLIEALGVVEFDPRLPHEGPYAAPGGRLEIRTIRQTPEGPTTKITRIDPQSAWVMEQYVLDAQRRVVASAVAEGYRRDPVSGLFLPSAVRISCPGRRFSLRIDLGNVEINRPLGGSPELWKMPGIPGSPAVDLGRPPGGPMPNLPPPIRNH